MTDTDQRNTVAKDLPVLLDLMKNLKSNCDNTSKIVDKIIGEISSGNLNVEKGHSFLDVKCHLFLSYLINVTYTMLRKSKGKRIEGDPAVDRIVEIRTVLEKMRPIEQKLKYQIDKLVKTAATETVNENDPLRYTANPSNLIPKMEIEDEDEGSGSDEEKKESSKSKVYVPPKLSAVHYDGDLTEADRQQRLLERAKKRALSSSIMQELRQEYYDGPEEVVESRDLHRLKADKERAERIRYEEEHMVRLTVPKSKKNKAKQLATINSLRELTHFGDINALLDEQEDQEFTSKRKKTKHSFKKKKGKKGFKRRK